MTESLRRLSLVTGTALVAVALLFVMLGSRGAVSDDVRRHASQAMRRIQTDGPIAADGRDSTRALSLAYVERARLGLGSPFRLVDEAIRDPRLADSTGVVVAWAILDCIFNHETYEIDASILDAIGSHAAGADHLTLIDHVISSARDPRVGETTIRLAYGLAVASGALSRSALPAVTAAAAMRPDRALAERDLDRATVRASENGIALIDELIRNRVTRALEVERPLIGALSPRQQEDAIAAVPGVLGQIEALHAHSNAAFADSSMLDARQAVTLSRLGARLPPVAAAAVILHSRGALLRGDSTVSPAMARFVLGATNEETLVAAYAYSGDGAPRRSPVVSQIMVSVAVGLRALAQEPVWVPGDLRPS